MCIGPKVKPKAGKAVVGDMCLVDLAKYAGEWPQVGKVIATTEKNCTVHWYRGAKTSSWVPCTRPTKERGKREDFLESVSRDAIWLTGFRLTPSGNLPKQIKDRIVDYENSM